MRMCRRVAFFAVLAIWFAALAGPRLAWSQENQSKSQEATEPPHALLYKTINFIILVGGLAYVLRKPLGEYLGSRSASIGKELEAGRKALEASQDQLRKVEEKLRGLEAEIAGFKASALRDMEAERERLEEASAEEAARILDAARVQMDNALRSAKLDLKSYTAQQSVALAEQLIRARLDDAGRKRLVEQFVATLETKERKN